MDKINNETLEITECENGDLELYSSSLGVFGYISLIKGGSYYVYYPKFSGFLKPKHLIYIVQELNRLNKYDKFKETMKSK
jgi:hypothetical protein